MRNHFTKPPTREAPAGMNRLAAKLLLIVMSAMTCVCRGETAPTISTVFASGQNGYGVYRIPAMVVSTNATILAFCEGRRHGRGDSGAIDLLLKRSTDGGKTWATQQIVWADADNTCGNPAPVVDKTTGVIWLLATWNLGTDRERDIEAGKSKESRKVFVTSSADDGKTWAAPKEITPDVKKADWRWYATGPVNGIQLVRGAHAGRLVIPCNHSEPRGEGRAVSRSHIIYSDDNGKTWHLGGIEDERTNESTIVELSNGDLMHNMRSYREKKLRAVATSRDGGMSWSPAKDDATLIEPVCEGSIFRFTWPENGEKSRILFTNPATSTRRENLTIGLSYDEGQTWAISRTLFAGPAGYSCLTRLPDRSIGCLFECGQTNSFDTISLARIPLGWLENAGK